MEQTQFGVWESDTFPVYQGTGTSLTAHCSDCPRCGLECLIANDSDIDAVRED